MKYMFSQYTLACIIPDILYPCLLPHNAHFVLCMTMRERNIEPECILYLLGAITDEYIALFTTVESKFA